MNLKLVESTSSTKLPPLYETKFIDLIRNRLGIIIHQHQIKELQKTIVAACHKFNYRPDEYLQMLATCPANSPLLEHLVLGVTIGETYFFRDKNQMQTLENYVLPKIISNKREQNNFNLRIWSAGCASGEELFTIAILLHELLPDLPEWTIQLLGTDINTQGLHKAVTGCYKEWSMRSISDYYKKKYFTKHNNEYQLSPDLTRLANFFYLNLNDDTFPSIANGTNAQDLILCRNVLIYFDSERITLLMKKFSSCLVDDGYLLLGASDPINIKGTSLSTQYQQTTLFSRTDAIIQQPVVEHRPKSPVYLTIKPPPKKPVATPSKAPRPSKPFLDERAINKLLIEGKWQEILNLIDLSGHQPVFLLNAQATALANMGQLDQAVHACEKSLAEDKANKNTYLIQAMILLELNRREEAEIALKKAIFLDHTFVFAHFQLGLLLLRNKKNQAGTKCLKNALNIAKTQVPHQNVSGVQSLNYGRLVEILEHEIELNGEEERLS